MTRPTVQRWAAFSDDPAGGNPAGVVLDAGSLSPADMQRIAADVGYAETAFVTGTGRGRGIRYFSPVAEVPFCGRNPHPLIVLADRAVFDGFGFDPVRARALMDASGWPATVIVLHRLADEVWGARNIFPVGAISEDPATGAGAAATGAYLRDTGAVTPPGSRAHRAGRARRPFGAAGGRHPAVGRHHRVGRRRQDRLSLSPPCPQARRTRCRGCRRLRPSCRPWRGGAGCGRPRRPS